MVNTTSREPVARPRAGRSCGVLRARAAGSMCSVTTAGPRRVELSEGKFEAYLAREGLDEIIACEEEAMFDMPVRASSLPLRQEPPCSWCPKKQRVTEIWASA